MTKYIKKEFTTLRQAEAYLNKLYAKYDYVRVVSAPMMSQAGVYIYEVE